MFLLMQTAVVGRKRVLQENGTVAQATHRLEGASSRLLEAPLVAMFASLRRALQLHGLRSLPPAPLHACASTPSFGVTADVQAEQHVEVESLSAAVSRVACRCRGRYKRYRLSEDKHFSSLFFPEKAELLTLLDNFQNKTGACARSAGLPARGRGLARARATARGDGMRHSS